MTEESKLILRGDKNANIIESISELYDISLRKASDIYFESETAVMIEEGISDLQCRSDKYLATLVWEEYNENKMTTPQ